MRGAICLLALFLSLSARADEEDEPLPEWSAEDSQRVNSGEFLASDILFHMPEEGEVSGLAGLGLQLPEPGPESQVLVVPNEIPDGDLAAYFSQKSNSLMVDPQKLLSQQEYRDCLSFLQFHASDSKVDMFVFLFDKEQIIPSNIKIDDVIATYLYSDRPAVLVFYYLGAPERSQIQLSPGVMRAVGEAERLRALQIAINQAVLKSQPVDQLDGFCVQMSNRIYEMEKAMDAGVVAPVQQPQIDSGTQHNQARLGAAKLWLMQRSYPITIGAVVVLAALLLGLIRRARASFSFVEFDVAPRMGGAHAAGVGAVISYASAKVPPVLQREQVPNYLRRM